MIGAGIGISFVGYTLIYYGLTQLRGGNWGLFDLILPSRWTPQVANTPMDDGSTLSGGVVKSSPAQADIQKVENFPSATAIKLGSVVGKTKRDIVGQVGPGGFMVR
jgi:hypothetical protein